MNISFLFQDTILKPTTEHYLTDLVQIACKQNHSIIHYLRVVTFHLFDFTFRFFCQLSRLIIYQASDRNSYRMITVDDYCYLQSVQTVNTSSNSKGNNTYIASFPSGSKQRRTLNKLHFFNILSSISDGHGNVRN